MTDKIVKSTERGQITLPKQWRDLFHTSNYILQMEKDKLVVMPVHVEAASSEEVLFDADRDNDGKGVPVEDMIKALRKIKRG